MVAVTRIRSGLVVLLLFCVVLKVCAWLVADLIAPLVVLVAVVGVFSVIGSWRFHR
jgi:hypothetical protein